MVTIRAKDTLYREINSETKQKMAYRYLGNTGMRVSVFSYGNWLTSDANTAESQKLVTDCVKQCHAMGINYFDSAEMYASGKAEIQLGNALKELNVNRKDIVVSTKLIRVGAGPNDIGLSRKRIIEGTRASLKRLQLDYVDIIFAHRPDYSVPMEEIVRGFSWLIDNGLAHYWGTSEWNGVKFEEACQIAERLGLHAPVVEQCQYHMMARERYEREYLPLFERRNMGTTIWSPLAGGILTGKYNDGNIAEGTRVALMQQMGGHLARRADEYFGKDNIEKTLKILNALGDYAKELGFTQAQLALAWSCASKDTSTAILGFSRTSQIEENLGAINLLEKWTPEIDKRCNEILGNCPVLETDWRTWETPLPRRLR